jgi:hypothetical protein
MIDVPLAHVGGIPIEETIGSLGPALAVGAGVAWAKLRDGLRHPPALKPPRTRSWTRPQRDKGRHDAVAPSRVGETGRSVHAPSERRRPGDVHT